MKYIQKVKSIGTCFNLQFIEEGQSGVQWVRVDLVAAPAAADVKVEGHAVLGVKMTVYVGEGNWVLKPGHTRRSVVLLHRLEEEPQIEVVPKKREKVESLN